MQFYHAVNALRLTTHAYAVPAAWGSTQYCQTWELGYSLIILPP